MTTVRYLLVVSADQKVRIAKRPHVYADEIAIPVILEFPPHWGRVLTNQAITVKVPDFSPEVKYEIEEEKS